MATPALAASLPAMTGLPDATPLIDDPAALRDRWDRDGVLYFRQAIDPAAVAAVREEYIRHLKEVGVVAPDAAEPIWNGVRSIDGRLATRVPDDVWQGLVHHPWFDRAVRAFLGAAPSWVPIVVHRTAPPIGQAMMADVFQGRHQDGVFNYGVNFITCWVPLMDVGEEVGGLAVVPGSQNHSYYDYGDRIPGRAEGIAPGKIDDALWRRPDYKVGDILMFHGMTAHAGLPNLSDRFRLSIDVRFVPGEQKPTVGTVVRFDGAGVLLAAEDGRHLHLAVDDETMVRGPKGSRVQGGEIGDVLFEGATVVAMPDRPDHAKLVRSVSRKYIDLPAAWFTEFPEGWVS